MVFRAELFVFCVALSYGVKICGPVSIWSNCLSVARRANFCLIGYGPIHINSSNSDLWQRLMDLLSQFEPGRLIINKIRAHWEYFLATTSFDAWLAYNNACADRVATTTNLDRGEVFWTLWQAYLLFICHLRSLGNAVRVHMARVNVH